MLLTMWVKEACDFLALYITAASSEASIITTPRTPTTPPVENVETCTPVLFSKSNPVALKVGLAVMSGTPIARLPAVGIAVESTPALDTSDIEGIDVVCSAVCSKARVGETDRSIAVGVKVDTAGVGTDEEKAAVGDVVTSIVVEVQHPHSKANSSSSRIE